MDGLYSFPMQREVDKDLLQHGPLFQITGFKERNKVGLNEWFVSVTGSSDFVTIKNIANYINKTMTQRKFYW